MVEEIASADGSAGWCLSVCCATSHFIGRGASVDARREVFGSGPVAVWTSLLLRARSTPADSGFQLSGSFGFGSGCTLARWVLVAEELADREGAQWFRAYIVPKEDADIKPDSWDAMGLKATASIDWTIKDRFVPAYRTFEYPFLQSVGSASVSTQFGVFLNQVGLTAFASGVGARALSELISSAPKTRRLAGEGAQSEDNVTQFGIGGMTIACRSGLASPPTQCSGAFMPVSPSTSARAAMPCLNSSGKDASEASSSPSARKPFPVKAAVTQRLSWSTPARIDAAE